MDISQINGNSLVDAAFRTYINTVGAVIFSFNDSFSPSEAFGGSWEKVTDRFLVGAGGSYSLGTTGGKANVTLTKEQMPSHYHDLFVYTERGSSGIWTYTNFIGSGTVETNNQIAPTNPPSSTVGGSQPHDNMPPYIGCNIWRKVA